MPVVKRKRTWPKTVAVRGTLDSVRPESARMATARFAVPPDTPIHVPGQYAMLERELDAKKHTRSFTIASSPNLRGFVEFSTLLKDDGLFTPWLHSGLRAGDTISMRLPLGRFTYSPEELDPNVPIVFLHGGSGVTPGLSICRSLYEARSPVSIDFFFANRTEADIAFRDELERMSREWSSFRLHLSVDHPSPGWPGRSGFLTGAFIAENAVHKLPDCLIYLCGPPPMMETLERQLIENLGVPKEQVLTESFL